MASLGHEQEVHTHADERADRDVAEGHAEAYAQEETAREHQAGFILVGSGDRGCLLLCARIYNLQARYLAGLRYLA